MRLAATEYQRYLDQISDLTADEWSRPTDCTLWDVRALAGHNLGMAEYAASPEESERQMTAAFGRGGVFIDALTGFQVEDRAGLSTDELITRYAKVVPAAAAAREHAPAEVLSSVMPMPQTLF